MLIDLLSSSNQINFNIIIAKMFGLSTAVYLSEIMTLNEKAIRKHKVEVIDDKQYFTISRKYVADRTTISTSDQKEIDKNLSNIEIIKIKKGDANTIFLDVDLLVGMLGSNVSKDILEKINKIASKRSPDEKKEARTNKLRKDAQTTVKTTNPELRTSWYEWIDSVINRYGKINKATVSTNEKLVDDFADHNLDLALAIINKTAIKGYDNMQYAIDDYISKHPSYHKKEEIVINEVIVGSEEF